MQDRDMHFRQNRKANQNTGRSHSRSWFIGVNVRVRVYTVIHTAFHDWIHDISVDVKGKGRTDGHRLLNANAAAAAVIAKRDAELRAFYVVVRHWCHPIMKQSPYHVQYLRLLSQNFLRMTKIGSGRTQQGKMIEYVCVVLINFRGYLFFFLTDIPCDMPRRGRCFNK